MYDADSAGTVVFAGRHLCGGDPDQYRSQHTGFLTQEGARDSQQRDD
jgi:hypothetical protein